MGGEDRSGKEREEGERKKKEGAAREILLQNCIYTCVHELPCCISSECYNLSKREDEEGKTEKR